MLRVILGLKVARENGAIKLLKTPAKLFTRVNKAICHDDSKTFHK